MTNAGPPTLEVDGAKLRQLRMLQGDTLPSFAQKCGLSFQYIGQLETGHRTRVSPPTFAKICDALGIEDRQELLRSRVAA
jgi:transcriptional regulator with XRE-family HTH domain